MAVVGSGASGILTTIQLIEQAGDVDIKGRLRIQVFDRDGDLARGPAYGTLHDCHILNMRASTMSMYADRPEHFCDWMNVQFREDGGAVSGDAYVPRSRYGRYLREQLLNAVEGAQRQGVEVEFVTAEVTDCLPGSGKALVQCGDVMYPCDAAVLCSGDIAGNRFPQLTDTPGYISSAWQYEAIAGIHQSRSVAVIGSSLTAVDVLVMLDALGHRGEIHCVSRLRSLPKVQGPPSPWELQYVTRERVEKLTEHGTRQAALAEIAALYRQEVELATGTAVDWAAVLGSAHRPVADTLPEDIREAAEGRNRWYAALDATGHLAPYLWNRMDDSSKDVFLARYASLWAMYRHSMPLPNAEKIWRMVREGQLHAHTGFRSVTRASGRSHTLTYVADGREHEITADYVVNATGASPDITELDDPLISNLLHAGRLRPHRHGGIDVDFATGQVIGLDGTASMPMYFVGPLTRGVHFYTHSVETLRTNAAATARALLRDLD